ncbi:MAG: cbb3-type cytochrome c oxidase subunit 3 [Rhodospirillales bacterium]|nr:cbb3-type cytochrome c oxidase subunit 3 [Rhodospirillales bacterium]
MIDFVSDNAGMIGLLFFFSFFVAASVWTFRPGAKGQYKKHAHIPLEEN